MPKIWVLKIVNSFLSSYRRQKQGIRTIAKITNKDTNFNDYKEKKNNRRTRVSKLSNRKKVNIRILTIMRGRKIIEELMFLD